MPRQLSDVTNNEWVDAIAAFGVRGLFDGSKYSSTLARLVRVDVPPYDLHAFYHDVFRAVWRGSLRGRVDAFDVGRRLALTPEEWAVRLAHKSENEIARMLRGIE